MNIDRKIDRDEDSQKVEQIINAKEKKEENKQMVILVRRSQKKNHTEKGRKEIISRSSRAFNAIRVDI